MWRYCGRLLDVFESSFTVFSLDYMNVFRRLEFSIILPVNTFSMIFVVFRDVTQHRWVSHRRFGTTYRSWASWTLKVGSIRSPETSVRNQPTRLNIPEDDIIQVNRTRILSIIMSTKKTIITRTKNRYHFSCRIRTGVPVIASCLPRLLFVFTSEPELSALARTHARTHHKKGYERMWCALDRT